MLIYYFENPLYDTYMIKAELFFLDIQDFHPPNLKEYLKLMRQNLHKMDEASLLAKGICIFTALGLEAIILLSPQRCLWFGLHLHMLS